MEPSDYLNQCWLLICGINLRAISQWDSHATILFKEFENYTLEITATSPRGQWDKQVCSVYKSHWQGGFMAPILVVLKEKLGEFFSA